MNQQTAKGNTRFGLRVTAFSDCGARNYNEDTISIVYQKTQDGKDLEFAYFGIFDGHGGETAAVFAKNHLMNFIVDQDGFWSKNDDDILQAIKTGFNECHLAMWKDLDNWPPTSAGLPSTAGTTASIAFIRNGKLYVGHCGDSGIVLGSENSSPDEKNWIAHQLTNDHKPENEEERERIELCGGKVMEKQGIHRVVWYRPKFPHQGAILRSTRIEEIPFLAVARSLGDLWSYNWKTEKFMVSPEPEVAVHEIDSTHHKCLVFASDGIWNMMDAQTAIDFAYESEMINAENMRNGTRDWTNPARHLVEKSLLKWRENKLRSDNCTVIFVAIDDTYKNASTVTESEECTRAIYDYSTNEAYNLDYMDPYHMQTVHSYSYNPTYSADQALPSFSNAGYSSLMQTASTSFSAPANIYDSNADLKYYTNTNPQSAFVKGCCHDQRFVLATGDEEIQHHDSHEHHREIYKTMAQKKFPPLHYAYRPVPTSFLSTLPSIPVSMREQAYYNSPHFGGFNQRRSMERYNYIRPSEQELEDIRRQELQDELEEHEERRRRQEAAALITDEEDIDETDVEDEEEEENDNDENQAVVNRTVWSDEEEMEVTDEKKEAEKTCEAEFSDGDDDDGYQNMVYTQQKPMEEDDLPNDSIQIFEISSSSFLGGGENIDAISCKNGKPSNKENARKLRSATKFYNTRQSDRKMRSSRVIGRPILKKRVSKTVKKVVKTLPADSKSAIVKKLEPISSIVKVSKASTSTSSKNKENNNAEKNVATQSKAKVGNRILRSSQTDVKEASSTTVSSSATSPSVVKNVMNIARNLRSRANANASVTSTKQKSSSSKTRKSRGNKVK